MSGAGDGLFGHPQAVNNGAGREYSELLILTLSGDLDKFPFH
jgi:hypothetical protein